MLSHQCPRAWEVGPSGFTLPLDGSVQLDDSAQYWCPHQKSFHLEQHVIPQHPLQQRDVSSGTQQQHVLAVYHALRDHAFGGTKSLALTAPLLPLNC